MGPAVNGRDTEEAVTVVGLENAEEVVMAVSG